MKKLLLILLTSTTLSFGNNFCDTVTQEILKSVMKLSKYDKKGEMALAEFYATKLYAESKKYKFSCSFEKGYKEFVNANYQALETAKNSGLIKDLPLTYGEYEL